MAQRTHTTEDLGQLVLEVWPDAGRLRQTLAQQLDAHPAQVDLLLVLAGARGVAERDGVAYARRSLQDLAKAIEAADEEKLAEMLGRPSSGQSGTA